MSISNFIQEILFRKKIERLIVDRRSRYTITFERDEELPLDVWTYLIKRRANFRCEDCGEENDLDAHHIRRPEDGGKNTLRNGRCLCPKCHPKYRIYSQKRKLREEKSKRKLIDAFGYPKGIEIFEQYQACKTRKERKELINKLTDEYSEEMFKWTH